MNPVPEHSNRALPIVRQPHALRDNIEGLLTAFVLALIIRHFVFEVFQIPTGSMSPTLLGQHRDLVCTDCGFGFPVDTKAVPSKRQTICPNCGYVLDEQAVGRTFCTCFPARPQRMFWRGSNRVIVNKFLTHFRPPERWNVVVFRYPRVSLQCLSCGRETEDVPESESNRCPICGSNNVRIDRKNYIKRVIGLPGEEIEIRHGDIYSDGKIVRKPDEIQEPLWHPVYDSAYMPKWPVPGFDPRWRARAGAVVEHPETGVLELIPDNENTARIQYAAPIVTYHAYNGYAPHDPSLQPVGDLQWDITGRLSGSGTLRLGIAEDDVQYSARIAFSEGAASKTALVISGKTVAESDFFVDHSAEHRLVFSNADDHLELRVDGRVVLDHKLTIPLGHVPEHTETSGAFLVLRDAEARFSHIRLRRDVYYIGDRPGMEYAPTCMVPADGFFVLGDNSRNSADGRYWGFVPMDNLIGKAVVVWWPPSHLRKIP